MAANHSRQQYHRIAAAFDADGLITGLRDDIVHDNGAYCRTHGVAVPELTVAMLPGPYRIPAYRGRSGWCSPTRPRAAPTGLRAGSRAPAAREHLLDVAAAQLGIDPSPAARAQPADQTRCRTTAHHDPAHRPGPGHRRLPGPARRRGHQEAERLGYRASWAARPAARLRPGHVRGEERARPQETADVTVASPAPRAVSDDITPPYCELELRSAWPVPVGAAAYASSRSASRTEDARY